MRETSKLAWRVRLFIQGFSMALYPPRLWRIGYARMYYDGVNHAIFLGPIGIGWWGIVVNYSSYEDRGWYWPPYGSPHMPIAPNTRRWPFRWPKR